MPTPPDKEHGVSFPTPPAESSPSWGAIRSFLLSFPNSLFCYIADPDPKLYEGADEIHGRCPIDHGIVLDTQKQARGYGIFYSVNGFDEKLGRKESGVKTLNAFYVDVDYPKNLPKPSKEDLTRFKADAMSAFAEVSSDGMAPTFIVETKNGLHGLWCLKSPIRVNKLTPEERELCLTNYKATLKAIVDRFNGDDNAKDVSRVLRLPNTWHLKDPRDPFLVKIAFSSTERYTFQDVKKYFMDKAAGQELNKNPLIEEAKPDDAKIMWKDVSGRDEPLPQEVTDTLKRMYPLVDRPSVKALMDKDNRGEGSRNHSLMIACAALRQSGWDEGRVTAYFDHYNGLSAWEITNVIRSVFRHAVPYEVGWNNPLIAEGITREEKAKVTAIVSSALAEYKRRERAERKSEKPLEVDPNITDLLDPKGTAKMDTRAQKQEEAAQKIFQRKMYEQYEKIITERFPHLRYVIGNGFYQYQDGAYGEFANEALMSLIVNEMEKDGLYTYRTLSNVQNKLMCLKAEQSIQVPPDAFNAYPSMVNISNGVVDIDTGELYEHDPRIFSLHQLKEITYDRFGKLEEMCPRWLRFIDEVTQGDTDKAMLLQEIAGYCFTRTTRFQRAFILYGVGANGKSTYVDTLMRILGENNAASLDLDNLQKPTMQWKLYGKTVNIIEEINNNYVESDFIKKAITGAEITADRKYMDPLVFRPYAKFLFAVNSLPKINDTSSGLYRRFTIIEFKASFDKNREVGLEEKLWRERDGIFLWALKGWQRLNTQNQFTISEEVAQAIESFKESNSPVVEFLLQNYEIVEPERSEQYRMPLLSVFTAYQKHTKILGYGSKNFQNFLREVQTLNYKKLAGLKIKKEGHNYYMVGCKFSENSEYKTLL